MSELPLFRDPGVYLEKRSSFSARLKKAPDEWPSEILSEAYRQLPDLEKYSSEVDLQRVDPIQKYAVGAVFVYPYGFAKTAASQEQRMVSFPVIVRDSEMAPLDVYEHAGSYYPFDKLKLAEILETNEFTTGTQPSSQTQSDLAKQIRPADSFLGETFAGAGLSKTSSARFGLASVLPFVKVAGLHEFVHEVADHDGLREFYHQVPMLREAIALMAHKEKTASTLGETPETGNVTVMMFKPKGMNYLVKTANRHAWKPEVREMSRFEVQRIVGDQFEKLAQEGVLLWSSERAQASFEMEKGASMANDVGAYEVTDAVSGEKVRGVVVPEVRRLDGTPVGMQMFIGTDVHGYQEKVAGVRLGDINLPREEFRTGMGTLVMQAGNRGWALEPLDFRGVEKVAGNTSYRAFDYLQGREIYLSPVRGVRGIQKVAENRWVYPDTMKFAPLDGYHSPLQDDLPTLETSRKEKTASYGSTSLWATDDGSEFWIQGAQDVAFRGHIYSNEDVYFPLGAMGLTKEAADVVIERARKNGSCEVPGALEVSPYEWTKEKLASSHFKYTDHGVEFPKKDFVKLAAVLAYSKSVPQETIDGILGLHFVTPENAASFAEFLPDFEKAASKMAEVLVASRLGLQDVRESSARQALSQMNEVINGLRTVQLKVT